MSWLLWKCARHFKGSEFKVHKSTHWDTNPNGNCALVGVNIPLGDDNGPVDDCVESADFSRAVPGNEE